MTAPAPVHPVAQAVHDAFSFEKRPDPYPTYAVLRGAGPFLPGPLGTQLVPRYAEAAEILQDPVWSHATESELLHSESDVHLPGSILWMEPPDHTRLRAMVSKAFTPRTIEAMRPRAEQLVDGMLDAIVGADRADLVEDLAYPLPLTLVCELLGVPASEHDAVRSMSTGISRGLDPDVMLSAQELAERSRAVRDFHEFFSGLVAQRRADPQPDLITALAQVESGHERLTPVEMIGTLLVLVVAGHETSVNILANGLLALARNPDQFDLLRADPDLARPAVDEILRYDAPAQFTSRTATAERTVSGRRFAAGDSVIVLFGSANRDPDAFGDADRFDIGRYGRGERVNRHLAFSLGLHYCLGAPLVRLETEVVLRAVARRVSSIELLATPPYRPNLVVRGMAEFPARLVRQEP